MGNGEANTSEMDMTKRMVAYLWPVLNGGLKLMSGESGLMGLILLNKVLSRILDLLRAIDSSRKKLF